jgi:hypothetical protein
LIAVANGLRTALLNTNAIVLTEQIRHLTVVASVSESYNDAVSSMLTIRRAAAYSFLLVSPCVYGQDNPLERRAADFDLMQTSVGAAISVAAITTAAAGHANVDVLQKLRYVDPANTAGWSGANAGAWINSAIADCPATGGTVRIAAGAYTIPLDTIIMSKPVRLVGDSRTSTLLTFTGASGTAILINYVSTGNGDYRDWSDGIDRLQILGPGGLNGGVNNAGVGIQIGDSTHIPIGVKIENTLVAGFTTGLTWGNALAWGAHIGHSNFINNTKNFVFNPGGGDGTENLSFDHTVFSDTSNGMVANSVQITGSAVPEIYFNECSFDGAQVVVNIGAVHFVNCHHENPAGNTTNPYVSITGGTVSMLGPRFAQDSTLGSVPTSFVAISGGTVGVSDWLASSAKTMPTVFNISGVTNVYLGVPLGKSGVTTDVTNASSGNVLSFPNANAQITHTINGLTVFATESKGINVLRLKVNAGTAYSGADPAIVPSAGFGKAATVSAATGFDQGFSFSVTAGGTGIAPNATITITFKDGSWTTAPQFQVTRNDTATPSVASAYLTWTTTATTLTITFNGTPTSGQVYKFVCLGMGN